jgi:hypothetical protein
MGVRRYLRLQRKPLDTVPNLHTQVRQNSAAGNVDTQIHPECDRHEGHEHQ